MYDDQYAKSDSKVPRNNGCGLCVLQGAAVLGRFYESVFGPTGRNAGLLTNFVADVPSSFCVLAFIDQELSCLTLLPLWVLRAP